MFSRPASGYDYTHEVLPGERIRDITKRYHLTYRKLRRQNRRQLRRGRLRVGQKLKIRTKVPSRPLLKVSYTVEEGDSQVSIVRKHKMKLRMLRRLNRTLRKTPKLSVGQTLWVVKEGELPTRYGRKYRLLSGPGYVVRTPKRAWGTFLTVTRMMEVFAGHFRRFPSAWPIKVHDLSTRRGGYLYPHKSHRRGRDVDICYPLNYEAVKYIPATPRTLDVDRTWDLIQRFLNTGEVIYIFMDYRLQRLVYRRAREQGISEAQLTKYFQYPRGRSTRQGIIRHEPGHADHLHIRFVRERRVPLPTS